MVESLPEDDILVRSLSLRTSLRSLQLMAFTRLGEETFIGSMENSLLIW